MGGPLRRRRPSRRLLLAGMLTAVVLAVGSTVGLAVSGAFRGQAATGTRAPTSRAASGPRCAAPRLAGAVVDVTLADMGGGMMGGPSGTGSMMSGSRGMGVARVFANPGVVAAGTVSLRAVNQGAATHELVVLPLPAGQAAGARAVGADGQVDEAGSLGEASRSCAAGEGDGIAAGATGWVTLTLQAGRYELVSTFPATMQPACTPSLTSPELDPIGSSVHRPMSGGRPIYAVSVTGAGHAQAVPSQHLVMSPAQPLQRPSAIR